jgi:hypothetical protein
MAPPPAPTKKKSFPLSHFQQHHPKPTTAATTQSRREADSDPEDAPHGDKRARRDGVRADGSVTGRNGKGNGKDKGAVSGVGKKAKSFMR